MKVCGLESLVLLFVVLMVLENVIAGSLFLHPNGVDSGETRFFHRSPIFSSLFFFEGIVRNMMNLVVHFNMF